MSKTRINITTLANSAAIRREKRNGRDILIVPSATLPDDVIMNRVKYPADEIGASYKTLNRTPAPYGHPTINSMFVSAKDPEGLNLSYIGAWNENVRREGGKVLLDKVIDVEVAGRTESGKSVLNAIDKGEPVHTSTGLYCMLDDPDGDDHDHIARDIEFDHDAILLDQEGAATPEQGVGMMVNAKGEQEEIPVINSFYEDADRDMDWAVRSLAQALEAQERASFLERMKTAIFEAFTPMREPNPTQNEKEKLMDKEQFDALSAKVNALTDTLDGIGEQITNAVSEAVQPITDNMAEMKANQKAKDKAELDGYIATIVKANILDEDDAKDLTLNAARKLAAKAKPGKAAGLNSAFGGKDGDDEFADIDLNAGLEEAK